MATETSSTVVESGSTVLIRVGEEEEEWTVVPPQDANAYRRRISEMSPLGFALLGRKVGETVKVRGPVIYQASIIAID